jgi:uncharacterized membrane protein
MASADVTKAAQHGDDAPPTTWKHGGGTEVAGFVTGEGESFVGRAVTINRPVRDVFAYFRDFSNLPSFMENVERVDLLDDKRSHWVVKAPAGKTVEWTSQITDEAPDGFIAWRSEDGADVANSGRVEFRDAGARGTVVTVSILYDPPAGVVGKLIAKMFQREPAIQARRDLRRFKQLMETGEIATAAMNRKQHEEETA